MSSGKRTRKYDVTITLVESSNCFDYPEWYSAGAIISSLKDAARDADLLDQCRLLVGSVKVSRRVP